MAVGSPERWKVWYPAMHCWVWACYSRPFFLPDWRLSGWKTYIHFKYFRLKDIYIKLHESNHHLWQPQFFAGLLPCVCTPLTLSNPWPSLFSQSSRDEDVFSSRPFCCSLFLHIFFQDLSKSAGVERKGGSPRRRSSKPLRNSLREWHRWQRLATARQGVPCEKRAAVLQLFWVSPTKKLSICTMAKLHACLTTTCYCHYDYFPPSHLFIGENALLGDDINERC